MSSNAATTRKSFKTPFSEDMTIGVMGKLKSANHHLTVLHDKVNRSLDMLEARILADPINEVYKSMLIEYLDLYSRSKCVATVYVERKDADGNIARHKVSDEVLMDKANISKPIQPNGEWIVSVVKGGTEVRVHLSDTAKAKLTAQLNSQPEYKKVTVY
jgi:vacuolar-type H+-ATPase subunit E/Vma4